MITIIASMEYELSRLRKELQLGAPTWKVPRPGSGGQDEQPDMPGIPDMIVIGVGKERAQATVRHLLESRQTGDEGQSPELLLLGVCGGVNPDLHTGDLVLAAKYFNGSQSTDINVADDVKIDFFAPDPLMWETATKACARESSKPASMDSLTVSEVIGAPEDKRWIASTFPVGIVEMEDYWVAEVAAEYGVEFLSARVVLDTADQALPGWLFGLSRSTIKAFLSLTSRPWRIPTVVRLARQRTVAQKTLTRFALRFLAERTKSERSTLDSTVASQSGREVSV